MGKQVSSSSCSMGVVISWVVFQLAHVHIWHILIKGRKQAYCVYYLSICPNKECPMFLAVCTCSVMTTRFSQLQVSRSLTLHLGWFSKDGHLVVGLGPSQVAICFSFLWHQPIKKAGKLNSLHAPNYLKCLITIYFPQYNGFKVVTTFDKLKLHGPLHSFVERNQNIWFLFFFTFLTSLKEPIVLMKCSLFFPLS